MGELLLELLRALVSRSYSRKTLAEQAPVLLVQGIEYLLLGHVAQLSEFRCPPVIEGLHVY